MQFIKFAGLSARQFDLSIGASNGYTLRMKKNNASIGSDVIENILKVYPQLNVVWLITGEGDMLKKQEEDEILDFDHLPKSRQQEIEDLIEQKIKERQEEELKRLLKEVTEEIEKTQKRIKE
ncbi:hypothetical protein [uncultured Eudoraea sp.]|uniref:hypothetical protein n=1 Tax=uncultured Eudoraea sp. TaxID=1035614 RepID=UPI003458771C